MTPQESAQSGKKFLGVFAFVQDWRKRMDEYIPKSRKVALGSGSIPGWMNQFDYMELVYGSLLSNGEKHVLGYLALRFNFADGRETRMGTRRAANDLHMSRNTFCKYRDQLEQKKWITRRSGGFNEPDRITLLIGLEDPNLKWKDPVAKRTQLDREQRLENDKPLAQ